MPNKKIENDIDIKDDKKDVVVDTPKKVKTKTEKYKVLLVKHDGIVLDYKGNGVFVETDGDYEVGQYIEYK